MTSMWAAGIKKDLTIRAYQHKGNVKSADARNA